MTVRVAVAGATGRLGSLICDVVEEHPDFDLIARLTSSSSDGAGAEAEIFVDATTPDVSERLVRVAVDRGQCVIVGTSGWNQARIDSLRSDLREASNPSVLIVPNFSLGSVLSTALARIAGTFFDSIEIIETHHPHKIDSPSGTAIRTAEVIAEARETPVDAPFADQQARGQLVAGIPVHSLRQHGVSAKQEVRFGGVGETLSIIHDTNSYDAYRAGIRAALEASATHEGLTIGLESILGIQR